MSTTTPIPICTVRVGKTRNHKEGISLNIFRDIDADSILLAQVYGADEDEARMRAGIVAWAMGEHYGARVKP